MGDKAVPATSIDWSVITLDNYLALTGKRFRHAKALKAVGVSREEAFEQFKANQLRRQTEGN